MFDEWYHSCFLFLLWKPLLIYIFEHLLTWKYSINCHAWSNMAAAVWMTILMAALGSWSFLSSSLFHLIWEDPVHYFVHFWLAFTFIFMLLVAFLSKFNSIAVSRQGRDQKFEIGTHILFTFGMPGTCPVAL